MLTESEKNWLEERSNHVDDNYCRWCKYNHGVDYVSCYCDEEDEYNSCVKELYYIDPVWEAAEFEARVAAKLADGIRMTTWMLEAERSGQSDGWARLKIARLQVEEEMDDE